MADRGSKVLTVTSLAPDRAIRDEYARSSSRSDMDQGFGTRARSFDADRSLLASSGQKVGSLARITCGGCVLASSTKPSAAIAFAAAMTLVRSWLPMGA